MGISITEVNPYSEQRCLIYPKRKNTKCKPIKCEILDRVEGSQSLVVVRDIDYKAPDPIAVGGKGWSRNTNTQLGEEYIVHKSQIVLG